MKSLVVGQVALSVVLLICTGLFARTLERVLKVDLGFRTEPLVWARLDIRPLRVQEREGQVTFAQVLERLQAQGSVRSAALGPAPLTGHPWTNVVIDGVKDQGETFFAVAGPGYFATLGVRLLGGRAFDAQDQPGSPRVAIVNASMARRFWPEGAIGRHFKPWADGPPVEVIAVAQDVRSSVWQPPRPLFYLPSSQRYEPRAWIVARSNGDAEALVDTMRREVLAAAPGATLSPVQTFPRAMARQLSEVRYVTTVIGGLGLVGLVLAVVGLYGLMSYTVGRATRDLGIRLALGADPRGVQGLVLGRTAQMIAAGAVLGVLLGGAAAQLLRSVLLGPLADPLIFGLVPTLLMAMGLAAAYAPARRASAVNPVAVLRQD